MLKRILFVTSILLTSSIIAAPISSDDAKAQFGKDVIQQVQTNPDLLNQYLNTYRGKVLPENIIDALKLYQTFLNMPSRFDEYLKGDKNALTPEEQKGYQLFNSYGCAACHSGANLGGTQYKKMGVAKNYFIGHKTLITPQDLGLYEVTKQTKDLNVFKVPPLRNVAITYPYYHDGSVKSLDEAVIMMGKYQLGVNIPEQDVKAIVAFMKTLTAKPLEK